jgi:hypothetical protein
MDFGKPGPPFGSWEELLWLYEEGPKECNNVAESSFPVGNLRVERPFDLMELGQLVLG